MGSKLVVIIQERDLGVTVDSSLKTSTQCAAAVKKVNRRLGIMKKRIDNKIENIILHLYKSIVCPHLEYCMQMWSPHLKKDILELEKVQKRETAGDGEQQGRGQGKHPGAGAQGPGRRVPWARCVPQPRAIDCPPLI
uniref:Uncharacterized protein n=1 Tax=Gopherus agassizii TaxID=38772 RepID=A0A452H4G2_9SAUR